MTVLELENNPSKATTPTSAALKTSSEQRSVLQLENRRVQQGRIEKTSVTQELKDGLDKTQRIDNGSAYISAQHINSGPQVKFWQERVDSILKSKGLAGLSSITDSFATNADFTNKIKEVQRLLGVAADGIIGPRTLRAIAQWYNAEFGEDAFSQDSGVALLSDEEYQALLDESDRKRASGMYNSYLSYDAKSSLKDFSSDPITLETLPEDLKGDLLSGARRHGYEAQRIINAVNAASKETDVPPIVILRVMQKESDFDPACKSGAGAMGLMQLMPANVQEQGVKDPFSIEDSILGGARELRQEISSTGSLPLGLAAYNAGLGNVRKHGGIPPFKETQNYVRVIMGRLQQSLTEEAKERRQQMLASLSNSSIVSFRHEKDRDDVNPALIQMINKAGIELGFSNISVGTAITGHSHYTTSGNVSRHTKGMAFDIDMIDGEPCNVSNPSGKAKADALVAWLVANGFTRNSESGNDKAVLWAYNDASKGGNHNNHIHVSMKSAA